MISLALQFSKFQLQNPDIFEILWVLPELVLHIIAHMTTKRTGYCELRNFSIVKPLQTQIL